MDEKDNIYNNTENPQPTENPRQIEQTPQYEPFMYEPIGFRQNSDVNITENIKLEELKLKKQHIRHEHTIIIIFFILVLITLIIGTYGIISDIVKSEKALSTLSKNNVII